MAQLTKEQFEQGYAKRSGVTVEWLERHGRRAALCFCDWVDCEGWQMVHADEDDPNLNLN